MTFYVSDVNVPRDIKASFARCVSQVITTTTEVPLQGASRATATVTPNLVILNLVREILFRIQYLFENQ